MLQALVPSRNRSRVFRQTVRHTALPAFRLLSDNAVIPKTTALAVPDATSRQNMPVYPKADIESTWKYTRENCPEPNELSDGKTFEFAGGATETRYKVCRCPTAYNKTDATCKNINTSEVAGASGNIVCSERSKPVSGSDPTFTPASCGSILGLDESDVCVDKETNVTYGKYCKCDGPSYSSSSCPNTTALVCKTSTSTNWQYIKCL